MYKRRLVTSFQIVTPHILSSSNLLVTDSSVSILGTGFRFGLDTGDFGASSSFSNTMDDLASFSFRPTPRPRYEDDWRPVLKVEEVGVTGPQEECLDRGEVASEGGK